MRKNAIARKEKNPLPCWAIRSPLRTMGAQWCARYDIKRRVQLVGLRPEAPRFRITSRSPIPASKRTRDVGSGAVVIDVANFPVHDDVVGLVVVHVLVIMDSPVSPVNVPVPPVNSEWVVTVPSTVPLPVKVPNKVPPTKTSSNVPLDVNIVKLEKMSGPMFVVVKGPVTESIPEPVKLESKTQRQGLAVAVMVEVPVSVPVEFIESA